MNTPLPLPALDDTLYLARGSFQRLVSCVRSLGPKLGWKYWRFGERARKDPESVRVWAAACRREAITATEPERSALIEWADLLDDTLEKWLRRQEAANDQAEARGTAI